MFKIFAVDAEGRQEMVAYRVKTEDLNDYMEIVQSKGYTAKIVKVDRFDGIHNYILSHAIN